MNPSHHQVGEQWFTCDRCGQPFPLSMLHRQLGLLVDSKCTDNLENYFRQRKIAGVLSKPELQTDTTTHLRDPGEITF